MVVLVVGDRSCHCLSYRSYAHIRRTLNNFEVELDVGTTIGIEVGRCSNGEAVRVRRHTVTQEESQASAAVSYTCGSGTGAKSVTVQCPTGSGDTCDRSDPQNPKVICGTSPHDSVAGNARRFVEG